MLPIGTRSRFVAYPDLGVSGLAYANPLEWREIGVWRRTLQPGDLFIDVGANIGSYTLWALEQGARVIAIEPNPRFAELLKENLRLNGCDARVMQVALGDVPGVGTMTLNKGVLNRLLIDQVEPSEDTISVSVTTLDEVLGSEIAAGVKIDVEGFESRVLRGAETALRERRIRLLQLEWNSASESAGLEERESTAEFLERMGYELFRPGDGPGDEIPLNRPGPTWDIFARPRS